MTASRWFRAILLLLTALAFAACASEKGPDDPAADGDDTLDGDTDTATDGDDTFTNPAAGHWILEDTNAFAWFRAEGLTRLYLIVGAQTLDFFMVSDDDTRCEGYRLRPLSGEGRYAPLTDPDTCWYQFVENHTGKLELYARHAEDPDGVERPWYFIFQPIDWATGYDSNACDRDILCIHYAVTP